MCQVCQVSRNSDCISTPPDPGSARDFNVAKIFKVGDMAVQQPKAMGSGHGEDARPRLSTFRPSVGESGPSTSIREFIRPIRQGRAVALGFGSGYYVGDLGGRNRI